MKYVVSVVGGVLIGTVCFVTGIPLWCACVASLLFGYTTGVLFNA